MGNLHTGVLSNLLFALCYATNNHQRFVRGQFEDKPKIVYDQNKWNRYSFYQQIDLKQIITFWTVYNRQLLQLVRHIPKENLQQIVSY